MTRGRTPFVLMVAALLIGSPLSAQAENFTSPIERQLVSAAVSLPVPADMCVMSSRPEAARFYNMLAGVQAMVGNRLIEVMADCPSLEAVISGKAKALAEDYVMIALPAEAATLAQLDQATMIAKIKPELETALGSRAIRASAETILSSHGSKAQASAGQLVETEHGLVFPMKVTTAEKTLAIRAFIGPVRHQPVLVYYYTPQSRENLLADRFGAYVDEMLRLNEGEPAGDIPLQIAIVVGLLALAAGLGVAVLKKSKGVKS